MEIAHQETKFKCADGAEMLAYLSKPTGGGQQPAIVVIHEAWGLNNQIRGVARRYSEQGFVAVAPHLFSRQSELLTEKNIERAMMPMWSIPREKMNDPTTIQNLMKSMSKTEREVLNFFFSGREVFEKAMADDLLSCTNFLGSLSYVRADRLGVTGFCLGGGLAYQLSTIYPFRASVPFYGANPKSLESVANINGPVLGIYAGEDERINSGVPALVESMIRYRKTFEMKLYKGAQHAFFNETRPVYNKAAAEDAWQLAVSFFNKYLRN